MRFSIGYQSYHCGYLYYTVVCIFDYYVLIQYCMSMCIAYRENNVSVIFAMIIMMNDDVHNIQVYMSSLACINRGGKMIHNICYSHLIMINTLYSYTCTVQVRVQYKVYYYYLLGSILFGGACTLYRTECIIIFCSAQFYLGGLKPPKP